MKKCIASVCMMIGALVLATGCGAQKEASSKVRMACFPNITHAQALVMKNQGMLEEKLGEDYEVFLDDFYGGIF